MTSFRLTFTAIVLAAAASPAAADCPVAPPLRLFSAPGGHRFVRVVTSGGGAAEASLYRIFNTEERLVWKTSMPFVPSDVWVDIGGRWVVTRGEYCNGAGQEHALRVYDAQGTLLRDWRRSDLVSDDELGRRGTIFLAHQPWTAAAELRFEPRGDGLTVILPWGESRVLIADR